MYVWWAGAREAGARDCIIKIARCLRHTVFRKVEWRVESGEWSPPAAPAAKSRPLLARSQCGIGRQGSSPLTLSHWYAETRKKPPYLGPFLAKERSCGSSTFPFDHAAGLPPHAAQRRAVGGNASRCTGAGATQSGRNNVHCPWMFAGTRPGSLVSGRARQRELWGATVSIAAGHCLTRAAAGA
jgi:hypothetical protein